MSIIQLVLSAFLLGLLGSLHCLGMCGPIAFSIFAVKNEHANKLIFRSLTYNLGRIVTYSVIGFIIGTFGASLKLTGMQQSLSIFAGISLLVYFFYSKLRLSKSNSLFNSYFSFIRKQLGKLYQNKSNSSYFFIGSLNGLLPCGFVYLALAGALATGESTKSLVFMGAFGLGTLPMMFGASLSGKYFNHGFQRRISLAYPAIILLMACLLILRGLNLGIPYLSPETSIKDGKIHSCCQKP